MDLRKSSDGNFDIRSLLKQGKPLSVFSLGQMAFRLSDEGPDDDGGKNLPIHRDDVWQDMLRMVLGHVPAGAEHAPPCNCQLVPISAKYDFAGLAGLPPAVRLMDGFFPVRDQSKRGACFAFALVALCEYMLGKKVELSEQSLFHFTKLVEPGKIEDVDDGAIIADSIRAVEEYGICPLSEWHYNPESWNYVEDPYNEGQGKALQRKLESAQRYRFHNWRWLPNGSVLHFKQALSAGLPIYTGVPVTMDWDDAEVRRKGVIPFPKLFWGIRVYAPPRGLIEEYMVQEGIMPGPEEADAVMNLIAVKLIQDTINYVTSAVFGCKFIPIKEVRGEDHYELVLMLDKIRGGHALCLAGYVDDNSYPGGGYFIARNSWSADKWAPDSPEMPGYALIPYAYIAAYGYQHEGVVMSEFPADMGIPSVAASSGMRLNATASGLKPNNYGGFPGAPRPAWPPASAQQSVAAPVSVSTGFEAWLAVRKSVLSRPMRDASGVLLRPGTPVLVSDPSKPDNILRDTPESRAKLRAEYEHEIKVSDEVAAKLREEQKAKAAAEREARFGRSLRETINGVFAADEYAVMSLSTLKGKLLAYDPDLAEITELDHRIRSFVTELQKSDPQRYWFGRGFGGVEELRPSGKDSDRIKV